MRKLPVAVALSAALHTGAIAWVRTRPALKAVPIRSVTARVEVTVADPPPTVVALLDDHTVKTVPDGPPATGPGATRAQSVRRGAAISTGHAATTETPGPHEPARSPLMTMRQPALDRGVSSGFVDRFLDRSRPLAPKEVASEQLADDLARTAASLDNPRWVANATPDELRLARERLVAQREAVADAELHADGQGTKAEHATFTTRFAPDGTVRTTTDAANLQVHGAGGSFDITDALMRRYHMDPYASAKLRALDQTRDERVALGKRYRHAQLATSRQLMQQNLDWMWAKTRDPAERRAALFELWDEIAETGEPDAVAAGADARAYLIGFIQTRLPAGSAGAFTPDELARLNARRRSKATFAPY